MAKEILQVPSIATAKEVDVSVNYPTGLRYLAGRCSMANGTEHGNSKSWNCFHGGRHDNTRYDGKEASGY